MRKRPIVIITISYILGIIGGLYFNKNIVLFLALLLLGMICVFYKLNKVKNFESKIKILQSAQIFYKLNTNTLKTLMVCMLVCIISIQYSGYKKNKYDNLYKNIETMQLVGVIISDCDESEYYNKHILKVKKVNNLKNYDNEDKYNSINKYNNTKLILKIKKNSNINVKYGDLIVCNAKYVEPDTSRNYGRI